MYDQFDRYKTITIITMEYVDPSLIEFVYIGQFIGLLTLIICFMFKTR